MAMFVEFATMYLGGASFAGAIVIGISHAVKGQYSPILAVGLCALGAVLFCASFVAGQQGERR